MMKTKYLWIGLSAAFVIAGCSGGSPGSSTLPVTPQSLLASPGSARTVQDSTGTLQDASFESDGFTYWQQCGTTTKATITSAKAEAGTYSDLNGTTAKPEVNGTEGLCQQVTVPTGGVLTFWVYEGTNDTIKYADQEADLLSSASASAVTFQMYKEATTTSGWVQRSYNLSAYAGQKLWLYFGVKGTTSSSYYIYQYVDNISWSGSASPTPSPTPTASGSPAPTPTPTHTPAPTPTPTRTPAPTPTPTPNPSASPCSQTQASGQSSGIAIVPYTTFTSTLSAGHVICFSAYVFTTASFDALQSAAEAGAKETVVLPNEEKSSDQTDATKLQGEGATIVWDSGTSPTHPLHAKLAVVDGVAYLDGRNWDTTDVVITDGNSADYAAINNALNLNPTSSTNLDTLKSNSVTREANYINGGSYSSSVTLRYMSESFGSDTAMNSALEAAALAGANVEICVLSSDESGNTTEEAVLTTLKNDGAHVKLNGQGGSEKIALISNQAGTGWFGSANSTTFSTNATNYIDWGLSVTDTSVLSSLQSYFDTTYAASTAY